MLSCYDARVNNQLRAAFIHTQGYSGYAAPSNFYLVYGSGDLIRYNGTSGALVNPGPGSVNTLMSKFVWADPDPYGPLTLSGVISPGNRAAVVVRQGKLLTVTFTLTRPANKAAPKVLKRDWVWENYTLEVDVPGAVREIKQPKMTPASTSTTQRTVGSTLVWENVPMPANGHAGYKRKFRFKAVVDPRYTGMLAFDAMAYNDNALALKTLTVSMNAPSVGRLLPLDPQLEWKTKSALHSSPASHVHAIHALTYLINKINMGTKRPTS